MKWTGLNEIREKFLTFYESKGHLRLPSFPLVPQGDKGLLLINSGMAPLKPYFSGEQKPPRKRVTTCQKCIRTPDIERVGKTSRHGTFFEMLGNFSFGDYFKREAISWAWEFVTKQMEIPVEKLYVSVYLNDDEAYDIWNKEIGVDSSHIVRLGKDDNFWEIGSGPCGPCSEIYFDRGEKYGCGKPDCGVGCDCDRFVEFWNLVFTQFNSDGNGNYTPLPHPNIDTGMGLERLACIMQGVDNLFEVDTVRNIMFEASKILGHKYGDDPVKDVSLRVITDHIRSTTFMVGDGVLPSNEGRGYVLRRLLRRAARHGKLIGIEKPFLYKLCRAVIEESKQAYPELVQRQEYIERVIRIEEEKFDQTIDQGLSILNGLIAQQVAKNEKMLSGADAFKLYDTFGFPIDLTREIALEKGISIDEEAFARLMKEQRERARAARAAAGDFGWNDSFLSSLNLDPSKFVGYEANEAKSRILAIIKNGEAVEEAHAGDEVTVILDVTPFYAESGGQVGDTGCITADGSVIEVSDCKKTADGIYLHYGKVVSGTFNVGNIVNASISVSRREAIMRNHSVAHLVQAALREVLGEHVEQAGSYVDEHRMRFDFTHYSAMTKEEIAKVENAVNREILKGHDVVIIETTLEKAKEMGAMALFGEKYGKTVRVVKMGGYSIELCGGTHVSNTAKIGLCRIVSESSVASGIRRIEVLTGYNIIGLINKHEALIHDTAAALKAGNAADIARRAEQLMSELKAQQKDIDSLNQKLANLQIDRMVNDATKIGDVKVVACDMGKVSLEALRITAGTLKDRYPDIVALLAAVSDEKINFVCVCGKDAVALGCHAGNIVREAAKIAGGGGGGKPESATAGGKNVAMLTEALNSAADTVKSILKI